MLQTGQAGCVAVEVVVLAVMPVAVEVEVELLAGFV
jgi:hypothetical protein